MEVTKAVSIERVRGPNLTVLIKYLSRVPFEKGLRKANEGNFVIASNVRLNQALFDCDESDKNIRDAFACWSGTMTAYVEPDTNLPAKIEYTDQDTGYRWIFSVPEEHRDRQNAILVAEHPNYTLEIDGNNRVVHATTVDLVENFQARNNGWYNGDPKHDIPIVSQDGPRRYLWRINKRVGPAARGYDCLGGSGYRHGVSLCNDPSNSLGMVVEAPSGGALEIAAPGSPIQLKLTRENPDTLIIKGTPEQVDAAIRLLGQLNKQ